MVPPKSSSLDPPCVVSMTSTRGPVSIVGQKRMAKAPTSNPSHTSQFPADHHKAGGVVQGMEGFEHPSATWHRPGSLQVAKEPRRPSLQTKNTHVAEQHHLYL
ncbi:hypothetical protein XPA_005827 [Xanthoria parietina]